MDERGGSEDQFLKNTISRLIAEARTALPGVVDSFDASTQTVTVIPAIRQAVTLDEVRTTRPLPKIVRVPLVLPYGQGSGLSLTVPIRRGDEVLLIFSDRAIDNWVDNGGVQDPVEPVVGRHHDLTDAIAIPGAISQRHVISNYSTDSIELRNDSRSVRASVKDDRVEIEAGGSRITINEDGEINIFGPDNINIRNGDNSVRMEISDTRIFMAAGAASIRLEQPDIVEIIGVSP